MEDIINTIVEVIVKANTEVFLKVTVFLNAATAASTEADIETVADEYKIKVKVINKFIF